ncbi:TPA_asm: hypothetical protein GEA28_06375 [Campylobacter coli]|uniref:hypothetical protein n=1 Tax=Campylobacter coli TaxID=195 RepID=UPI000874EE25|nr:hypothetical protein [Campylobacter coli]OEV79803.1 hypothetical protein AJO35_05770 [Campylobacter coli]OEV81620.1 hypothetical protein AJ467_05465 [Campylobacter coli]OEX28481.1 hypothetical protein A0M73_03310 [Campylobacter coli]OEX28602.1 hypothetical protein A0M75_05160 [Campylobacter coli]OEX51393.1 hypothetical protein A0M89_04070 [Campylobacter coli]
MDGKKILIFGFISDNFLEISSFLEKNKIKKAEIEEKISYMLNTISSSKESTRSACDFKIQKMYHCLLQDFNNEASKKRCYIANQNLLYIAEEWLKLDENVLFVLLYENPIEILRQKIFSNHKFCFKDILMDWLRYNNLMLEFYSKNNNKCILMNYSNYHNSLIKYLSKHNNPDMVYAENDAYIFKNKELFDFLLESLINKDYQIINDSYEKLEKNSLSPICKRKFSSENAEKEIVNLFYFIETNSILKSKNKSLLDFIFDIQEDLEKLHQENCRLEAHIKNQNSLLSFCMKYGTAKQRIQNQLSYRLGQTIINSKNIFKILFMPIFLLSNIISFKQERQVYNKKIKKDPSLILPPLEKYPDYQEAIKFKNYLSYRLGQVIIKGFKNPLSIILLPYEIVKLIYKFRKR